MDVEATTIFFTGKLNNDEQEPLNDECQILIIIFNSYLAYQDEF